jgi:hypothetical protein
MRVAHHHVSLSEHLSRSSRFHLLPNAVREKPLAARLKIFNSQDTLQDIRRLRERLE